MSESQLSLHQPQELSIPAMLSGVIQSGVTKDNVEAIERLCGLYERMEAKGAEKQFNADFVKLQQEMPVIVAKTEIKNRGKYERFEDVMHVVGPILVKNGFAVRFSNEYGENRVTETCHLSHIGGHSTSNSFTVRVSKNADSETQADCKAATTAKRNALLNALNIVIRQDFLANEDDANNVGEYITPAEVQELTARARGAGMLRRDVSNLLASLGATTFEQVPASRYAEAHSKLRDYEARKAGAKKPEDDKEHTW